MVAFITGNLMAAFVIPNTSEQFFYTIGVGINLFCIFYYLLIRNPLPHLPEDDDKIITELVDNIDTAPGSPKSVGSFAQDRGIVITQTLNKSTSVVNSALLRDTLLPATQPKTEIQLTWELVKDPRMLALFPLMIYSGASLAIYSSSFVPLMTLGMDPKLPDTE